MMKSHTLYSYRRCPYAMRARMALWSARIPCDAHEIDFKNKPDEVLQASPKGTVPILVLNDGYVIDESFDIVLWALKQNDPDGWLQAAGVGALIAQNDSAFKEALDRYKYPNRFPDEDCENARETGLAFLQILNNKLMEHAFLMSDRKTIVDICIFPFVRQFANVDKKWFDKLDLKPLKNWLKNNLESDVFQHIMIKHKNTPYSLL